MTALTLDKTLLVATMNAVEVAPAGIVTEDGTVAADVSPLPRTTFSPPNGAAAESIIVPFELFVPPITDNGLTFTDIKAGGLGTVKPGTDSSNTVP